MLTRYEEKLVQKLVLVQDYVLIKKYIAKSLHTKI